MEGSAKTMNYSKDGLKLTEGFESCRLVAYPDVKGVITIGWGHTPAYVGQTCTQEQADAWLLADVQTAVSAVNRLVKTPLTQHEFDALVDFNFNCGVTAFAGSTMLKLLNQGNHAGAAAQFQAWDHAAGKVVAGLLRRRQAEEKEFETA
jgi:lysozyme